MVGTYFGPGVGLHTYVLLNSSVGVRLLSSAAFGSIKPKQGFVRKCIGSRAQVVMFANARVHTD